ncbi:DUF1707 SHOCT-like domain-containing protein [Streptomyces avicenniae]|uniref:DUF1707 SHOCT-like domain-containing protein n=1 Tax=Streptomyces avicenniae TaxID=500153 RepID=UPI000B1765F8|nr:DUF1707 domain-containing protein [Streptomyces avicenniae]
MTAENPPAVPLGKEPPPPPVRASDADRDRVAEILAQALSDGRLDTDEHAERLDAVYGAKTLGELEPLVRDLPEGQHFGATSPTHAAPTAPGPWAAPGGTPGGKRNVVAVLSGSTRHGRWRVGGTIDAVAVLGGIELDFTEALFEQREVVVNAVAVLGGIEIRVPDNVSLRCEGSGFMGGFDVREFDAPEPGAPVVVVKGFAFMGGVEAKSVRGKRVKDLRKD